MPRGRDWTRYQRRRAIRRKAGILRRNYGDEEPVWWTGGKPGRLSKGKIHCSCWMCRSKSYDHPSRTDAKKASRMSDEEREWTQMDALKAGGYKPRIFL